jgi:hypothetical protein
MGFFKPAGDAGGADEGVAAGDEDATGTAEGSGALTASAEGEGGAALADLGVDLDADEGREEGSAPGL